MTASGGLSADIWGNMGNTQHWKYMGDMGHTQHTQEIKKLGGETLSLEFCPHKTELFAPGAPASLSTGLFCSIQTMGW